MIYRSIREMVEHQIVFSVSPETTVHQAAVLMKSHGIGALPVLRGSELIGIFTERDLVSRVVASRLDPQSTSVAAVMTTTLHTIAPEKTLCEALNLMHEHGFRHLPVVDRGHLIAMLSLRDIPTEYQFMRKKWLEAHQAFEPASA